VGKGGGQGCGQQQKLQAFLACSACQESAGSFVFDSGHHFTS
jgi:hypothetical protein